VVQKRSWNHE